MKVLQIIFIALLSVAAVAIAYKSGGNWFVIGSATANFSTADPSTQSCSSLTENQSCIITWTVNASGGPGSYELFINFSNSSLNKYFNGTIFDKGNNSNVIPNYSCTGCAFKIVPGTNTDMRNPLQIGNLTNNGTVVSWNVSALGPVNSTWDLFTRFTYSSTTGTQKDTNITKIRVVDYPWWNTSWNCRQLINVTQNTGNSGNGVVEISNFVSSNKCEMINCSKEIRITEILSDKSQEWKTNTSIQNETYINYYNASTKCSGATIKFNANLNAGQTKQFFVYYNNPITEIDYFGISGNTISNQSYTQIYPTEFVWDLFFDSHVDTAWNSTLDGVSVNSRNQSNLTTSKLRELGYNPQRYANRENPKVLGTLKNDKIYWFFSHGSILGPGNFNETVYSISTYPPDTVYSHDISNISGTIPAKFVMMISSFGGDNGTSLIGCPLQNWLSKAFVDKGTDCFLAFRGTNENTTCTSCNCGSDVTTPAVDGFNDCFWRNITAGKTIRSAFEEANNNCDSPEMNPILIEEYSGACDQTL